MSPFVRFLLWLLGTLGVACSLSAMIVGGFLTMDPPYIDESTRDTIWSWAVIGLAISGVFFISLWPKQ